MVVSRRDFLRTSGVLAAAGLLPGGCSLSSHLSRGRENAGEYRRPNIICIFSDEADPDYLGCYGGDFLTPHLDSIARDGARFDEGYSVTAVCTPSRFSAFTGRYPGRCAARSFVEQQPTSELYSVNFNTRLTREQPCLGRLLSRGGYFTGFVGKWHVWFDEDLPDYDVSRFSGDDDPDDPEVNRRLARHQRTQQELVKGTGGFDWAGSVLAANRKHPLRGLHFHPFEWLTRGALDFLETAVGQARPFFLYTAPTATHGPDHANEFDVNPLYTPGGKREEPFECYPPRPRIARQLREAGLPVDHERTGMLYLDYHVAAILQKLRELGIERNTLVIYVADHGVEPGKATCYQEGVHVPMLMKWPAFIPAGTVTEERAQIVDLLPTCMDAAGIPLPPDYEGDGISVLPAARGQALEDRDCLYFEIGTARGLLKGPYKFITYRYQQAAVQQMKQGATEVALDWMGRPNQSHSSIAITCYPSYFDPDQLYDLSKDPYEQKNLVGSAEYAGVERQMRERLRGVLESFRHPYPFDVPEFMRSERFARLVKARREQGVSRVGWWPKDYEFPPKG